MACHNVGVACTTDTPHRPTNPDNATGSPTSTSEATTTPAPHTSGKNTSNAAISNETVVTANNRSPTPNPTRRPTAAKKPPTAARDTTTPFGTPVDPDV
ncbi:hypothetical protein GCM10009577_94040 [Streptomyces javensis]